MCLGFTCVLICLLDQSNGAKVSLSVLPEEQGVGQLNLRTKLLLIGIIKYVCKCIKNTYTCDTHTLI